MTASKPETTENTQLNQEMYTNLPVSHSKHQGAFGKFAARQAALEESPYAAVALAPPTPYTPSSNNVETASPEELLVGSCSSLDVCSPLFDSIDLSNEPTIWTTLFPNSGTPESSENDAKLASVEEYELLPELASSLSPNSHEFENRETDSTQEPSRKRQRRSTNIDNKVDGLGLTAYNRKPRLNPLKPVEVVGNDETATKRAKNTEAARRSRARRVERMGQLEDRVRELMGDNERLEAEVSRLKKLVGED